MKKHAGFTLIELIIGIAIMLIIFGGIVYIFGASTKSAQAGMNHKQAYEAGRQIMDEIKTTMRYADTITPGTDSITYSVSSDHPVYQEHWADDLTKGKSRYYSYTISWKDSNKKQIKIEKSITQVDPETKTATKVSVTSPVYYPSDDNLSATGAFDSTEYKDACDKMSNTSLFPIMTNDFSSDVSLYRILIPFKYKDGSGTNKVEVLQTEVTPTTYAQNTSQAYGSLQEALASAVGSLGDALKTSGSFPDRISSGGLYTDKSKLSLSKAQQSAATAIKNFLSSANSFGTGLTVDNQAWLLIPPGVAINNVTSDKWILFVAKNVINDQDGSANANGAKIAIAQGKLGVYYIRRNYGFFVYKFTIDTSGNLDSQTGTLGYASGVGDPDNAENRIISASSWTTNYLNVINNNNKKIEDSYTDSNFIKGTRYRIDYDGTGSEYTLSTMTKAGTPKSYKYPPNGATVFS